MLPDEAGYLEVEARIVDQYDDVGTPREDGLLALCEATQNGAQMQEYGDKAHVGQVAVVAEQGAALLLHGITPKEAELSLCIEVAQRLHEMGGMEVATGFAGYQEIFHAEGDKG